MSSDFYPTIGERLAWAESDRSRIATLQAALAASEAKVAALTLAPETVNTARYWIRQWASDPGDWAALRDLERYEKAVRS